MIFDFFENRVLEHATSDGHVLAVKLKSVEGLDSEGDMMHYAATHGVLAPQVRGVYDVVTKRPLARVLVSDRVAGVALSDVWKDLNHDQRASITEQLRAQITQMRTCIQPFIGRVGRQHTGNVYDRLVQTYCGPFADEEECDNWRLARLTRGRLARWKWNRMLERERRKSHSGRFVLTHGDLTPRNILVQDGVITGIVDWEYGGFYPEYAEYAFAMVLCHSYEKWWIPILKKVLEPCSCERLEFTKLVEDRGF